MEELMIKIENVSKQYKLGQIGGTTLRDELQRRHAKRLGKEDPTKKIGAREVKAGETFMALDGVSFNVKPGERVGIIGHNGAGKSTLLKLLSRVTAPTSGRIRLNGRVASMLEVGTGFHPELTGRENIYMNGAILGMTKKEIDAKMEDIIEFSECRQFIDTPVKRYSSGMYVKLAFSVAAHLDSEIMIMDEVLAVGDVAFQQKCLNKMSDVSKKEGRTILYVSHNMNTIRQLCDRVIVLNHGQVVFDGDVDNGIGKYLQVGKTSSEKVLEFSADQRQDFLVGKNDIELKSFELLSHDNFKFHYGEVIVFNLDWYAKKEIPNLAIRIKLVNDYGMQIANYYLELKLCTVVGDYRSSFEMDLSQLMYGKYNATIVFSGSASEGTSQLVEAINNAFSFEIVKREQDMYWSPQYWGNIKLDGLKMISKV